MNKQAQAILDELKAPVSKPGAIALFLDKQPPHVVEALEAAFRDPSLTIVSIHRFMKSVGWVGTDNPLRNYRAKVMDQR